MTDALTPTKERLRKAKAYDAPAVDPKANRPYYRVKDAIQRMYERQEISEEQEHAARKWERHWLGSLGHDVRNGEGGGSGTDPIELVRSQHASEVARVQATLKAKIIGENVFRTSWTALIDLVEGAHDLAAIGKQRLPSHEKRETARAVGLTVIQNALSVLVDLWQSPKRGHPYHPP